jgi:hypothetical protein
MMTATHWLILLLACLATTSAAAAVECRSAGEVKSEGIESTARPATCTHVGNTDLYGLGIRLGVYLQLFSTLFANHFLPETAQAAWDANAVFLVAIFIATVKSSTGSNHFAAFEAFIMLQMQLAFVLAVFNETHRKGSWHLGFGGQAVGRDFSPGHGSQLGHFARTSLTIAIASYQVWYWFVGAYRLDHRSRCTAFVFLFTRISILGRAVIVFKIGSTLYLVIKARRLLVESPIARVVSDLSLFKRQEDYSEERKFNLRDSLLKWYRGYGTTMSHDNNSSKKANKIDHRARNIENTAEKLSATWHMITLSCSLMAISWSIVAIETTLVWNRVSMVYSISSTGQLIPLVAAIAGTVQIAVHLLSRLRIKVSAIPPRAMLYLGH